MDDPTQWFRSQIHNRSWQKVVFKFCLFKHREKKEIINFRTESFDLKKLFSTDCIEIFEECKDHRLFGKVTDVWGER